MCVAVSAARLGCKVALINDRPLLGGNNTVLRYVFIWVDALKLVHIRLSADCRRSLLLHVRVMPNLHNTMRIRRKWIG